MTTLGSNSQSWVSFCQDTRSLSRFGEDAIGEVEQEYMIEARLKGGLELTGEFSLEQIVSSFDEYAPYEES